MFDQENVLETQPRETQVQNDKNDPLVRSFIKLYTRATNDQDRADTLEEIDENRTLKADMFALISRKRRLRRFKDDFLLQTSRRFSEEGTTLPKPIARSAKKQAWQGTVAESILERQYDWSYFYETYQQLFEALKTDGLSFLHLSQNDDKTIDYAHRELGDVVFDPNATDFNDDPRQESAPQWAIVKYEYTYDKALEYLKELTGEDWDGNIMLGDPAMSESDYRDITDRYKDGEVEDKVGVWMCYHLRKNKFAVVVGGGSTKAYESEIPFKARTKTGGWKPRMPLIAFQFSAEKKGAYPMSMYGLIKDVSDQYRDALDRAFQHFKIQMNPYMFLFTEAGTSVLKQMREAEKHQELGAPPLILAPSAESPRLETMQGNVDVIGQLEQFRVLCQDKIAARLGMNPRQQEQVSQTFSEFERKNQMENQAIAFINRLNKKAFSLVANFTIDLVIKYGAPKTKETLDVTFEDDQGRITQNLDFKTVVDMLDDWQGRFEIDTNIKIPISATEKMATINEIGNIIRGDVANPAMKEATAKLLATQVWEKAKLRDLENIITREMIDEAYSEMVQMEPPQQGGIPAASQAEGQDSDAELPNEGSPMFQA